MEIIRDAVDVKALVVFSWDCFGASWLSDWNDCGPDCLQDRRCPSY